MGSIPACKVAKCPAIEAAKNAFLGGHVSVRTQ